MRLLRVELERFRSRPVVLGVLLVVLLLSGILIGSAAYATRPVSATERASAEQLLQRQQDAGRKDYQRCLDNPTAYFGTDATTADCDATQPTIDWFLPRSSLDLGAEVDNRGTVVVVLLAGAAIVVGATFAGADWSSGSISNQLLFRPRRTSLWVAKAVTVVAGCAVTAAVVLAAFWGVLGAVASARGITVPAATWTTILQTSGRGVALVAAVALGGFALTMLLRHTVATLGLLFAYAVVGEGLAASLPIDRMSQWSMAHNVLAWVHDGTLVLDTSICDPARECDPHYILSLPHAAAYLGVLLLLAVVASVLVFRRRDVA